MYVLFAQCRALTFFCASYHVCFHVCQEREQQIQEFLNQPGREITRYGAHLRDYYTCSFPRLVGQGDLFLKSPEMFRAYFGPISGATQFP